MGTIDAGDFLFIPADLPHQPVNLSESEPAMALVAPRPSHVKASSSSACKALEARR